MKRTFLVSAALAAALAGAPARSAEDDSSTLRDLYRQCSAALSCEAGMSSSCTEYSRRCLDYVDGVGAPLQFACLATHDGVKVPYVLASDPATTHSRAAAVVAYGKAHPDALEMTKSVGAVMAISSQIPCTTAPAGALTALQ